MLNIEYLLYPILYNKIGRVQTQLIKRLLNCNTTTFEPLHRGGLSNEFCCFSNYESEFLKWKDEKDI